MKHGFIYFIQITLIIAAILTAQTVIAQLTQLEEPVHQQTNTQSYIPKPGFKPEQKFSSRAMQRTGTAINGARNSISIKSTDAGIIHYPPAVSTAPYPNIAPGLPNAPSAAGCINCGIIDFINIVGQGNALNAIASGIVAGTIVKKIGGYGAYSHPNHSHDHSRGEHTGHRGQHQHYQVGITMHDGSQQVITVPDVSNLQYGDRIQLIDGIIIPEHKSQ